MRKLAVAAGLLSAAILFSCKKDLRENAASADDLTGSASAGQNGGSRLASDSAEHVPNQLLIRFKKGTSATGRNNALTRIAGKVQEHIVTNAMRHYGDNEGLHVVNTPFQALEALSKLKGSAEIENVGLNYIYTHYQTTGFTSSDPYYTNSSLWGMYGDATSPANRFGSQSGEAWAKGITGSKSVVIGIIDEGVMDKHNDLLGNVDPTRGYDYANNDATTYDGASDDHGTHVAGTIGALGNKTGVVGVNWNISMIPVKFLGSRGGSTTNAIKAIDHFTNLKLKNGVNVIATNNSWGGGGYSKDLENAITRAGDAGILFICAAGNDGRNIDQTGSHSFPACYYNWNIIAVAATTSNGSVASFSNYGQVGLNKGPDPNNPDPTHSFVDIGAPGAGIQSTVPAKNGSSSYASYNGTSMATPHVTGAAALWVAANDADNNKLLDKTINIGGVKNSDGTYSGGTTYDANSPITAKMIKQAILYSAIPHNTFTGKWITGSYLDVHSAWQCIKNNSTATY